MPAKSRKQQKFMGRCCSKGGAGCPSKKVACEFAKKPQGGYRKVGRKSRS